MASVYQINKGINTSIEFQGLKAQYIWYFGGMILALLLLFAVLYMAGMNTYLCLLLTGGAAAGGSMKILALSHKYGEYGLMKMLAKRQVPKVIKAYSRKIFQS